MERKRWKEVGEVGLEKGGWKGRNGGRMEKGEKTVKQVTKNSSVPPPSPVPR